METKHPATQESPRVLSTLFLSAAVTENKQSWAPTLHRDCGVNNSSLAFMMNSSGLQSSPIFFFFTVSGLEPEALSTPLALFHVCDYVWQPGIYPQYTAATAGWTVPNLSRHELSERSGRSWGRVRSCRYPQRRNTSCFSTEEGGETQQTVSRCFRTRVSAERWSELEWMKWPVLQMSSDLRSLKHF